jgi:predicted MFS family arabinose efflux permease
LAPARRRSLAADLREGIGHTATHPAIAALLVLLIAIGIGGRPLNDLLPGFAAEVVRAGAGGLSLLASATGAGAILGGLWRGHRADSAGLTRIAIGASVGGALTAAAVGATDSLSLAIPAIMAFGFCVSSAGIAIQTLVQLSSDRAMRGRVMGLYGLIFRGAPAIGGLTAGAASTWFGLRWPVVLGALLVLAACAWTWRVRAQIEAALPVEEPGSCE